VLGIGGIVVLTLGGLLLVDGPIPELRVHLWTALGVSVPLGVITVFLMSLAIRARRNKVTTGSQGLIGETGIAQTDLSPAGTVFVHGELWRARSRQPVANGEQVRVTRVTGLQLEVEPFTEPAAHADAEPARSSRGNVLATLDHKSSTRATGPPEGTTPG
jgi:membrane-bound serine protease (ClpP class)